MRPAIILAPLFMLAAPALAEPLTVAKGMWSTSTDIYFSVQASGEALDVPSEHSTLEECWMTDEEVTIDEGMASFFPGCTVTSSEGTSYSFDMDLTCDFDGTPMTGGAEFAVNKSRGSFSGRIFLAGGDADVTLAAEGLLLGHQTGACPSPN